jgi:hypothetical protein
MLKTAIRFSALSLLISCNSNNATDEDAEGGRAIQRNVTEAGVVDQPRDLAAARVELVASGAADWQEMRVGGDRVFLPKGARSPDLSVYHFGRGDIQYPTSPTTVQLELSGLAAWQQGHYLQIVSPNAGMTLAGIENALPVYPGLGATALGGQAVDWRAIAAPLVDVARGDSTWVAQMEPANHVYARLTRAGAARDFAVGDGRSAKLTAALAPVAQDRTLALHWRGAAFAALAAQAGPGAQPAPAPAISIRAVPEALARNGNLQSSFYTGLPSLVDFGPISGAADLDQTVTYGNPFSTLGASLGASPGARWTEVVTVAYALPVSIRMPEGVGTVLALMVSATPAEALAKTGELAPAITPVRDVKLGGQSLDAARSGVGTAPSLTWTAPATGTATGYTVTVHELEGSRLGVNIKKVATLHTRSTQIKLPAELLRAGANYTFTITAISAPGVDLTTRPFAGSLPYASADHVTARITP